MINVSNKTVVVITTAFAVIFLFILILIGSIVKHLMNEYKKSVIKPIDAVPSATMQESIDKNWFLEKLAIKVHGCNNDTYQFEIIEAWLERVHREKHKNIWWIENVPTNEYFVVIVVNADSQNLQLLNKGINILHIPNRQFSDFSNTRDKLPLNMFKAHSYKAPSFPINIYLLNRMRDTICEFVLDIQKPSHK